MAGKCEKPLLLSGKHVGSKCVRHGSVDFFQLIVDECDLGFFSVI